MVDQSAVGCSFTPATAHVEPGRSRYFFNTLGERNPTVDAAVARTNRLPAVRRAADLSVLSGNDGFRTIRSNSDRAQDRSCPRAAWRTEFSVLRLGGGRRHATFSPRVTSVTDKKGGAMTLIVVETPVTNQDGIHVADVSRTIVVRN